MKLSSEVSGQGGGVLVITDSPLHDDWHGTVWLILPPFILWIIAPWFEHAQWIINDEACIFVVANDKKKLRVDRVLSAAFMWLSQYKI